MQIWFYSKAIRSSNHLIRTIKLATKLNLSIQLAESFFFEQLKF